MRGGDSEADDFADREATRKACGVARGEAAGEELGTDPADRCMVNVGTVSGLPSPPPSQGGDGQVRRRLMARGWDGASVVVRGRESRPHGEGRQQVRSSGTGMSGGRR